MDHSYEEIRAAALDVLAGRAKVPLGQPKAYSAFSTAVAEAFALREAGGAAGHGSRSPQRLSTADGDLFLEVFWELFRQGIITLGSNDANPTYPHFRLSRFGDQILQNQDTYFFHDVSSYATLLKKEVPAIDPVTMLYLKEALQAFRSGLASCPRPSCSAWRQRTHSEGSSTWLSRLPATAGTSRVLQRSGMS